jgi:hypothetical protein
VLSSAQPPNVPVQPAPRVVWQGHLHVPPMQPPLLLGPLPLAPALVYWEPLAPLTGLLVLYAWQAPMPVPLGILAALLVHLGRT